MQILYLLPKEKMTTNETREGALHFLMWVWGPLFDRNSRCSFFFFLRFKVIIYLLLLKTHFWLDSDLEVEFLSEGSLCLLAICSWLFSLASFILLANSLVYSAASSFFVLVCCFLVCCFFRAIGRPLCCWTRGVTWSWASYNLCFRASWQHTGRRHLWRD